MKSTCKLINGGTCRSLGWSPKGAYQFWGQRGIKGDMLGCTSNMCDY